MEIQEIIRRPHMPEPWSEGDNIPWNDSEFSRRMLKWHLAQDTDAASRRGRKIDQHVDWIHSDLLAGRSRKVLDLACGPGLYANRLEALGHNVLGIDFSPASIAHAKETAASEKLTTEFIEGDIRNTEYGTGYDLAMLIFGEFNVFRPADVRAILDSMRAAIKPGGLLLLEPSRFEALERWSQGGSTWSSSEAGGLWRDGPHISFEESIWDPDSQVVTRRYYVLEPGETAVSAYAQSTQAYTDDEVVALLEGRGFANVRVFPSLFGPDGEKDEALMAITAIKRN